MGRSERGAPTVGSFDLVCAEAGAKVARVRTADSSNLCILIFFLQKVGHAGRISRQTENGFPEIAGSCVVLPSDAMRLCLAYVAGRLRLCLAYVVGCCLAADQDAGA